MYDTTTTPLLSHFELPSLLSDYHLASQVSPGATSYHSLLRPMESSSMGYVEVSLDEFAPHWTSVDYQRNFEEAKEVYDAGRREKHV